MLDVIVTIILLLKSEYAPYTMYIATTVDGSFRLFYILRSINSIANFTSLSARIFMLITS